ncbi:hypothetical protein [Nocardioides pakistanensis]
MTTQGATSESPVPEDLSGRGDDRFTVMILPVEGHVDTAAVYVDARPAGTLVRCEPEDSWRCFDGSTKTGHRWLPAGVDPCTEGPETVSDAAMLLLVLSGYDPEAVIRSLGRDRHP